MTREEKIKGLYSLKEYLVENPIELEGYKSLPITLIDYAIEALEQDSILDKIRAEIEELPKTYPFVNHHIDMYVKAVKVSDVTKIIDKYKAGGE